MPNAERIAALLRLAYGAGTTDAERGAALDELEAIRDGRVVGPAASGTGATPSDVAPAPAGPAPTTAQERATAADPSTAPTAAAAAPDAAAAPAGPPARRHLHWAAIAGALALAIGYGFGSITTVEASGAAPIPTATPTPAATPPLEVPPGAVVDVEDTRVVEVFDREPTEADLAVDLTIFSFDEMDPASPRLLATRSDGMTVWVARTVDGDLCLAMRITESGAGGAVSAGGTCTMGGLFPVGEGLGFETFVAAAHTQGGGYYSAYVDQWGDLTIRVAGISAGPRV